MSDTKYLFLGALAIGIGMFVSGHFAPNEYVAPGMTIAGGLIPLGILVPLYDWILERHG